MENSGSDVLVLFAQLAIILLVVSSAWIIYTKAGHPGWTSLIPFYNIYILLLIVGKPTWWLILFCIPVVNIVVAAITMLALAQSFGKQIGFGIGLILLSPIFFPILAFGDAVYVEK